MHPKQYADQGASSMHVYCTTQLGLSGGAAYKRIGVARAGRRFPLLVELVGAGRLHLSGATLVVPQGPSTNNQVDSRRERGSDSFAATELNRRRTGGTLRIGRPSRGRRWPALVDARRLFIVGQVLNFARRRRSPFEEEVLEVLRREPRQGYTETEIWQTLNGLSAAGAALFFMTLPMCHVPAEAQHDDDREQADSSRCGG